LKDFAACDVQLRMPNANKVKIRETALTLLVAAPSGLRRKELLRHLCEEFPGLSPHVAAEVIQTLRHSLPPGFTVLKGVYRNAKGEACGNEIHARVAL
jgi:hypothetical protein